MQGSPRSAVMVLGMHRSGTSALAGVLAMTGCAAPRTQIEVGRQNPHGFFGSRPIARLDDRILAATGSSWHDWRPVDPRALAAAEPGGFREAAASLVAEEFAGAGLIVLKDPRICRLAPIWLDALAAGSYRPLPVLIHRDPLEVAQSLRARNGFPLAFGVLLWWRHVLDAERLTRGRPRAFTSYDRLLADWRSVVEALRAGPGLDLPLAPEAAEPRIDAVLSADLRHFTAPPDDDLPDPSLLDGARDCLAIMERWAAGGEEGRDHEALDRMHALLTQASWTYVAPMSDRIERLEAQLGASRKQATSLEAQISQAAERHAVLQRALDTVHGTLLEMVSRNQELDREHGRQVRELGALAGLLKDAEERQGQGLAENRKLTERIAELTGQLSGAARRQEESLKELRKWTDRTGELKGQLAAAQSAHDESEERYQQIIRSSSWRVTAPVRRVIRQGQRLLGTSGSAS